MTTITAVNSNELVVNNAGRVRRVSLAALLAVDEQVASCARVAVQYIGAPVTVPSKQPREICPRSARPQYKVMHGICQ